MWRSPEAHLLGVEVVAGSNPVTPTILMGHESLLLSMIYGPFIIYVILKILHGV